MSDFEFYDTPLADIRDRIFVFGSNIAGRHGRGAAKEARQRYGAIYGKGVGLQGRSYAIPTKDAMLRPLLLEIIETYIEDFVVFTHQHPSYSFYVTAVGCGLASFHPAQIAPLFAHADRCLFPLTWKAYLI